MDRKARDTCRTDTFNEIWQHNLGVLIIDTDPALDRDLYRAGRNHRGNAVGNQCGPFHQHCTKAARLYLSDGQPMFRLTSS